MDEDLKKILALDFVAGANLENMNGFGIGTLKDGRPFYFGRANGDLEMEIYKNQEELDNGFEAVEFYTVSK